MEWIEAEASEQEWSSRGAVEYGVAQQIAPGGRYLLKALRPAANQAVRRANRHQGFVGGGPQPQSSVW